MKSKPNYEGASWTAVLIILGVIIGLLLSPRINADWSSIVLGFFTPLFAAALGGYSAFWGIRRNQNIEREEKKVELINRHIYQLKNCLMGMCQLKMSYYDKIGTNRYRSLNIRRSINSLTKIAVDVSDIQFLLAGNEEGVRPEIDLVLIDSAFHNYNLALEMWMLRDRTQTEFLEHARASGATYIGDGSVEGDIRALIISMGQDNVDLLVHTGEKLIQIIDATLDQLTEALDRLQMHASKKINRDLLPQPMIAHYYLARDSIERHVIETVIPEGDWVNTPLYEKPMERYPQRDRLLAKKDLGRPSEEQENTR